MILPIGFIGLPGGTEWLVILIVALLLFGRRLPEVMRGLGRSVTEFKRGMNDITEETLKDPKEEEQPKTAE